MRLAAAFVAHELRTQGRSLRFRTSAVLYVLVGTLPAVLIHLQRTRLSYFVGSASPLPGRWAGRRERGMGGEGFRDPGTIVLFAATAAYVAAALFGPSLIPLPADLAPDGGNLILRLRLPEGTTLDETERRVQEIEKQLKEADEIESFWSRSQEGDGLVIADIRRRDRQPDRIGGLVTRLRYNIAAGGSLTIDAGTGPGGRQTALSLEDRPEADEDGRVYRAVLRSADLPALLAAYDRSLGQLALPTGADLERPSLRPSLMQRERVRLLGLAVSVPLLLFAAAACRLGSLLRGLVALAPLALGLLAATPLIRSGLGQADDLTVFALAAALALTLPAVVEGTVPVLAGRPSRPSLQYRWLRRETPWIAGAVPALVLGLAAPTLGLDPQLLRWVTPLRAAAVAGGTALLTSALLSPALLLLVRGGAERLRHPEEVRRRQRPPAWSAAGLPVLEAGNLTKVYKGKVTALSTVRFELTPGIVGLLGPNGAGKTTLLRILTGLLDPSRGEVRFRGVAVTPENLAEYRRQIGFLPQEFNAYPGLTAEQFLDHWARELGMGDAERHREIEQLLEAVGLTEHARRKVRDFSGGMRQRVGIARALLGSPPILIVDEPTTGLDVESRTRFRQILLEQAAQRVVLFSTHIASDVEAAASRILLLHRGRLRFDGTPEELTARARGRVFRDLIADTGLAAFSRRYRITARVRTLEGVKVRAVARPGEPTTGELVEPNLEEAYLAETDLAG